VLPYFVSLQPGIPATRPRTLGKKYLWFRFPTDPIFFCRPYCFLDAIDRTTLFSPGGCGLLMQRAKMASVVTLVIEPNCLNLSIGKYASLVNMSGLYCKSPSKKTPKPWKTYFKKPDLPTLIFSRYETTLIFSRYDFFRPNYYVVCIKL
jgi:hypothetical protein